MIKLFDWFKKRKVESVEEPPLSNHKYDWLGVPDWVDYISTDEDGFSFGYQGKPIIGCMHSGFWYGGGKHIFLFWPNESKFNKANWRESLESRPENI